MLRSLVSFCRFMLSNLTIYFACLGFALPCQGFRKSISRPQSAQCHWRGMWRQAVIMPNEKLSAWWKPVSTCIAGNAYLLLSVTVMFLYMLLQLNAFIKGMLRAAILVIYEMSLTSSVPCTHSPMPHIFSVGILVFLMFLLYHHLL